jgi:hypothetical protein
MKWLYFKLYGNVGSEPKRRYHFTALGKKNIELIERQVSVFLERHAAKVNGFYVTRYSQDGGGEQALYDHVTIPEHCYGEFVRLRFRVEDADYEWAFRAFLDEVIVRLQQGGGDSRPESEPCLQGWRYYEGYEARGDVGARFGDLPHGVDPTEQVVAILTAFTRFRFFLLDYPDFALNHDLVHLYFNQLGLPFPEEMAETERLLFNGEAAKYTMPLLHPEEKEALQECAYTWRRMLSRAIDERSNWLGRPRSDG